MGRRKGYSRKDGCRSPISGFLDEGDVPPWTSIRRGFYEGREGEGRSEGRKDIRKEGRKEGRKEIRK
jgi:hypothetical protein